jgi:carboxyl-terminal processing protease
LQEIDAFYVDPIEREQWDAILKAMGDKAAAEYPKNGDWDTTLDDMFNAGLKLLKDPHTDYWNPEQTQDMKEEDQGSFVGIGATLSTTTLGVRIKSVFPKSGAKAAGIRIGDIITSADGTSLAGMPLNDAIKRLRGQEGTFVQVGVMRHGRTLPAIKIGRAVVNVPQVLVKMAADRIGYVYLAEFGDKSDEQVIKSVDRLIAQGAKALILDLRGDPGGRVSCVAKIASEFLKNGEPIVSFAHQDMLSQEYITDGDGKFARLPLVVLVDKNSASASEIMAGAMKDLRKGIVVIGSHTYGKGSEQTLIPSEDGLRTLHITINHNLTPKGRSLDAKHDPKTGEEIHTTGGVEPNVVVPVSDKREDQILENIMDEMMQAPVNHPVSDPALKKAIEVLEPLVPIET